MLRTTLLDALEEVTLKLEGSLAGLWVKETETAWRSALSALIGRQLVVDIKAVDHVDHYSLIWSRKRLRTDPSMSMRPK